MVKWILHQYKVKIHPKQTLLLIQVGMVLFIIMNDYDKLWKSSSKPQDGIRGRQSHDSSHGNHERHGYENEAADIHYEDIDNVIDIDNVENIDKFPDYIELNWKNYECLNVCMNENNYNAQEYIELKTMITITQVY